MMTMSEIYVSVDIESNGPIPGPNSMLSLGAAAFKEGNNEPLGTFSCNLEELPGSSGDPDTMKWWATQPEAWKACRENLSNPESAMKHFVHWVEGLGGKPVFVGYPAGFDFLFVYWYMMKYVGRSPFSFSALDIKSYACAVLGLPYRDSTKRNMPKEWFPESKHTHVAVEDAVEQGQLFMNMLKYRKSIKLQ